MRRKKDRERDLNERIKYDLLHQVPNNLIFLFQLFSFFLSPSPSISSSLNPTSSFLSFLEEDKKKKKGEDAEEKKEAKKEWKNERRKAIVCNTSLCEFQVTRYQLVQFTVLKKEGEKKYKGREREYEERKK